MADLSVGDIIRIDKLETVIEYFKGVDEDEMVGTPYGEFNIGLVEKVDPKDIPSENELTYAEDYHKVDLSDFVGIVPIRELEDNEELDGICQIKDERTGITHVGFAVKVWDTASLFDVIWIGSKLAQEETWLEAINKEIEYLTGGDEMKSMNESMCDNGIIKSLQKIKKKFE